jgi:hypothetical protein
MLGDEEEEQEGVQEKEGVQHTGVFMLSCQLKQSANEEEEG